MEISHLGHSSFKIKGKSVVVVTDPFDPEKIGIKFPKIESDIVTISHNHPDHNCPSSVGGTPLVISGPGEYEVKGVQILGLPTYHDGIEGKERGKNTLYRLRVDGISLVHCGDLGHLLSDKDIEPLEGVDILFVPVGGFFTISAEQATSLIAKLDPHIVIPMHYKVPGLDEKTFGNLSEVSTFLKEIGKESVTPVPKLSITKDKLPEEQQIVVLE